MFFSGARVRGVIAAAVSVLFASTSVAAAAPAETPSPVAPLAPPPSENHLMRPTIYVKGLDHLAVVVKEDRVAGPLAETLLRRRAAAIGGGVGGVVGGLGLLILSETAFRQTSYSPDGNHTAEPEGTMFMAGLALTALGVMAVAVLYPRRSDLSPVVEAWNGHHVDDRLVLPPR